MFNRRGSLPTAYNTVFEDDEEGSNQDSPVGSCYEAGKTLPGTFNESYQKCMTGSPNERDKQITIVEEAYRRSNSPSNVSRSQNVAVSSANYSESQSEIMLQQKPQLRLRKRSRSHEDVVVSVQPTPKANTNNYGAKKIINKNLIIDQFKSNRPTLTSSTSNLIKPLHNPAVSPNNNRLVNRRATWCIK